MSGPEMLISSVLKVLKIQINPDQVTAWIKTAEREVPQLIARANLALSIIEQRLGTLEKQNAEILSLLRAQSSASGPSNTAERLH